MFSKGRLALALSSATLLSLLAACGGGVKTAGASASPTPSGTATSNPTSTPTAQPTDTSNPTPTPSASPTATPAGTSTTCSFVWLTDYTSVDGTYDFYEVDVTSDAWKNTTTAFDGQNAVGYYISGYDPSTGDIVYEAGMTIDGTIALNVTGTAMGNAAGFNDAGSKTYYDAYDYFMGNSNQLGSAIADDGTGSFTGNLSDPDPNAAATPGTGIVTVNTATWGPEDFGGDASQDSTLLDYAVCQ